MVWRSKGTVETKGLAERAASELRRQGRKVKIFKKANGRYSVRVRVK